MASIDGSTVKKLTVASTARMGSRVGLASTLSKQLATSGVMVKHLPVSSTPHNADLVFAQTELADHADHTVPNITVVPNMQFLSDPAVAKITPGIQNGETWEA